MITSWCDRFSWAGVLVVKFKQSSHLYSDFPLGLRKLDTDTVGLSASLVTKTEMAIFPYRNINVRSDLLRLQGVRNRNTSFCVEIGGQKLCPNNRVLFQVRAKTGTKDLITIMIKDMEITIVPMVVIKTIVAMAAMIILGITMGTMDMDRDMQTTVVRIFNLIS